MCPNLSHYKTECSNKYFIKGTLEESLVLYSFVHDLLSPERSCKRSVIFSSGVEISSDVDGHDVEANAELVDDNSVSDGFVVGGSVDVEIENYDIEIDGDIENGVDRENFNDSLNDVGVDCDAVDEDVVLGSGREGAPSTSREHSESTVDASHNDYPANH